MSLVAVLPEVRSLSRLDKIRLIQVLAQDLEHPISSPDTAFAAAVAMLQALEEDKGQPSLSGESPCGSFSV